VKLGRIDQETTLRGLDIASAAQNYQAGIGAQRDLGVAQEQGHTARTQSWLSFFQGFGHDLLAFL
jgi:hypothetical protein